MARPSSASRSQRWAQHLADFDRSGLTVTQFCDSIGCSVPTFYNWKRKLGKAPVQPAFLRVQSVDAVDSAIEIKLPSGVLLRLPLSAIASLSDILDQVA
ncbi:IS66 family insertion sequence element accessory protein TnpA [Pirellulaceae bacterium SH467]